MDDMPHVNPRFDTARVLRESGLRLLGFAPAAAFRIVGREFKIDIADPRAVDRERSIYAFVVDGEVVRIGKSDGRLAKRFRQWEGDITRWLCGHRFRARTQNDEAACMEALMTRYRRGTVFAKLGGVEEERELLRRHHPRMNRSDR